ncbi:teichoic acids export ABC transporter ATP-binding subunit TagH [Cytobacillus sp. FSL K6-0265]|uniref:teichoic acids export ABC transporter ATP-binding subunit TagH n=1 Tax=Cytobacillus sp. FSL K6-0265 TaxID=2921448 RepID=UPI0030FB70F6
MAIESVHFENVTKRFKMYQNNKEKLLDIFVPKGYGEDFYGLQHINFTAYQGDVIGVIGINGAGKSTLSNLITGVVPPTTGNITINGSASLIAIASGLNNQLTGRENIELKCLMLGFNKREIKQLMPEIIDFADIGKFIDQPVKNYSSGMKSRLGFAISVNIDPDIIVIDEALSVGDQTFTDKCLDKMNEFKQKGKTIFFISHSIAQVKKFCDKALWLEAGEVRDYGTIGEIIPKYEKFLKDFKSLSKEEQKKFRQDILDRRSQLNDYTNTEPKNTNIGSDDSQRTKPGYKKWKFILGLSTLLILLSVSTLFLINNNNSSTPAVKNKSSAALEEPNVVEEELKGKSLDIRYVTVSSANIRQEPTMESEAIDFAIFGFPYEVLEEKDGWAKIQQNDNDEGWVSTTVLARLNNTVVDPEMDAKLNGIVGLEFPLERVRNTLGEGQVLDEPLEHAEYIYKDEVINGVVIDMNGPSTDTLFNQLGEPDMQLEETKSFLYHGEEFDYLFQSVEDGTISSLQLIKRS